MSSRTVSPQAGGFSLVEVMVALIVMSVGLLGIAKMQAVALSNTAIASTRSLAAIEASSLAASMHANRGYWSSPAVAALITLQGATVTPTIAPVTDTLCLAASCTPASLAAYDLQQWTTAALQVLPPDYVATITCTPGVTPPNCTIQIRWAEKSVALNKDGQKEAVDESISLNSPIYELYVEP
ncbi:MAG: type pilus assembly protein PilV [Gammaproteobacteria bacterium]|jgi:type IV pilus assembly protein PilV|nr:type pilus assembly protein PilV [Gammaproteobacteria bacterium]